MTYITDESYTWDALANKLLGDVFRLDELMSYQDSQTQRYFIVPIGTSLYIPDSEIANAIEEDKTFSAPWS